MKRQRKLFALLTILALLLSMAGCTKTPTNQDSPTQPTSAPTQATTPKPTEPPEDDTPSSPILYRATDSQGNIVYLFGSIHIGTEKMYPLPDYVMDAYHSSDVLAVEFDVVTASKDITAATEAMTSLVLTDGTKISDHISPELYDSAVEILKENHYYMSLLDMYTPVMWYSLIDSFTMKNAGMDKVEGIDVHLLNLAHKENKSIEDIESMKSQYDMLAGMSMELQTLLLESAVASYSNPLTPVQYLQMCNTWATGDETKLVQMISSDAENATPEQQPLLEEYNQALMGERNPVMAQYARDALASGKTVFVCVGAAHIVGPSALVELLSQDGYTLERIQE